MAYVTHSISTSEMIDSVLEKHKLWLDEKPDGVRLNSKENNEIHRIAPVLFTQAQLIDRDFSFSCLQACNLSFSNFRNSKFIGADLRYSSFYCSNLQGADLRGARLEHTDFFEAQIDETTKMDFELPYACPSTGSFIAYKKADSHIVKLEILEDAKRCSATSLKCRCNKAKVLAIEYLDDFDEKVPCDLTEVASNFDKNFIYKVGEIVEVEDFDPNRWHECAPGIHFFVNRINAVLYY